MYGGKNTMIVQKEFLNKLKDFGLNSYESKLSDISNVPRSRAYDVLESLEKKGFIIVKVGKPIKYLAVPPAEVVERVKKKVVQEAEQKNQILSNLKESDLLNQLNTLHTEGVKLVDPTDKSGAFRGRDKVHEHLTTMVKNAKKSVTLMVSKDGLDRKYELLANHLRKVSKNGVNIRVATTANANKEIVSALSKVAKVKSVKGNARFCIVDNSEMLLFLTDDENVHKSYDCAVWVEAPHFVNYFGKLFEAEWKR